MIERCLCPEGMMCLALFLGAFIAWLQAHPKWPVLASIYKAVMGAALILLAFFVPANAQDMTRDEATDEAEAVAAGLEAEVQDGATQTVDADSVPGFVTDDPAATGHYGAPSGLESAGVAAMVTSEESAFVTDSMAARPIVTPDELATWTANGLAVEGDASTLVTEYGGAFGDCTTTVTGGSSTSY
ncbi:MAG: hypothetical protein AAFR44_09425, partial [Pseudomonadota bacterium]